MNIKNETVNQEELEIDEEISFFKEVEKVIKEKVFLDIDNKKLHVDNSIINIKSIRDADRFFAKN